MNESKVLTTKPITEMVCPPWCTGCYGFDGELLEHRHRISLNIGVDKDGDIEINQPIQIDGTGVQIRRTWAYVGTGRDADLSSTQLRSMSAALFVAADLMHKIDEETSA